LLLVPGDNEKGGPLQFILRQRQILESFTSEAGHAFAFERLYRENDNGVAGLSSIAPQALCQIIDARGRHHLGQVIDTEVEGRDLERQRCSGTYQADPECKTVR
jgi:hypothetical protein